MNLNRKLFLEDNVGTMRIFNLLLLVISINSLEFSKTVHNVHHLVPYYIKLTIVEKYKFLNLKILIMHLKITFTQ